MTSDEARVWDLAVRLCGDGYGISSLGSLSGKVKNVDDAVLVPGWVIQRGRQPVTGRRTFEVWTPRDWKDKKLVHPCPHVGNKGWLLEFLYEEWVWDAVKFATRQCRSGG